MNSAVTDLEAVEDIQLDDFFELVNTNLTNLGAGDCWIFIMPRVTDGPRNVDFRGNPDYAIEPLIPGHQYMVHVLRSGSVHLCRRVMERQTSALRWNTEMTTSSKESFIGRLRDRSEVYHRIAIMAKKADGTWNPPVFSHSYKDDNFLNLVKGMKDIANQSGDRGICIDTACQVNDTTKVITVLNNGARSEVLDYVHKEFPDFLIRLADEI